jgi:predicted DNA binding CopG/RHH family protein
MKKAKKLKIGEFKEGTVELGAEELNPKNAKVRITMFLDGPILDKAKNFANLTDSKYQTLLNECLNETLSKFLEQKLKGIKKSIQELEKKLA